MRREWLTEDVPFPDEDLRSGDIAAWADLAARRREGDRIMRFDSPPETWRALCGRAGYALVRDGEVIACVVTMMN